MTVVSLGTEDVPLAGLEHYPGNPRRGNVAEIRKSLRRLGQYRSLVVRVEGGRRVILAGNHTCRAMRAEGWTTGRAELVECTDDEARRVNVADNRLGELPDPESGERYDRAALAESLAYLDGDFEGTGWTDADLAALFPDEDGDGKGDAPEDNLPNAYGVIVTCETEAQQARLLQQLDAEGFQVRALMT